MSETHWNRVERGKPRDVAAAITREIERCQVAALDTYELYFKLIFLYDPWDFAARAYFPPEEFESIVTENIIKQDVDTVTSVVARSTTRPVFLTDEGDWKTRRRAADLGRFAEGLAKLVRLDQCKARTFKDGCIFGIGLQHWEIDEDGNVTHERYIPLEVAVNQEKCLTQEPREIHLYKARDREWAAARYPGHATKIENAPADATGPLLGLTNTLSAEQILIRTSYYLPIGTVGRNGYRVGRKVVSTSNDVLLDEDYEDTRFPISTFRWTEPTTGWSCGGLVHGSMGTQRTINHMNDAFDQQVDMHASPIGLVNANDIGMIGRMQTTSVGRLLPWLIEKPEFVQPPVIAPEALGRFTYLHQSHKNMAGISEMHAHGVLPARLETGAAVRESNDVASERFAIEEQQIERWYLDSIEVMIMLCRRNHLRKMKTPDIGYSFAAINRRIKWGEVDLRDVAYQIQAAPQLSRTLAGRMDVIATWANQGWITPEEARHQSRLPDLDQAMSLFDAYIDNIDRTADILLDGHYVPPDPHGPMPLGLDSMLRHYYKAIDDGAPEDRLENVRQWMDQAAFIIAKAPPPSMLGPAAAPAPA